MEKKPPVLQGHTPPPKTQSVRLYTRAELARMSDSRYYRGLAK